MLKLVLKDLLAARWLLLLALLVAILYPIQPFWPGEILPFMGGIYGFIALFIIFFLEDRNKTEIQYLSMPIQRRTVVRARYLLGSLLVVAGGIIVPLVSLIVSPSTENGEPRLIFSLEIAAAFLLIYGFALSLYLCCYHRFGFGRGTTVFVIAGVVLMTLAVAGLKAGGSLSIPGILRAFRASLGTPLFLLAAAAAVIIPFIVSLRLSLRFYACREF
jgi:hypothetical protein